ncbi:MAG TPA: hypothetical protein VGQ76_03895 [Thermoanaerobaculia bacterium]|jgi:hypothetical protein|nr:hypothetical protein [Thermoanaerobaculia bacterium]
MSTFRVALLVVCLAASTLLAQAPEPHPVTMPDNPAEMKVPQAQNPIGDATEPERELRFLPRADARTGSRLTPVTESLTGTSGSLDLDAETGVLLDSLAATPNSYVRLGTSDSTSRFVILSSSNTSLFTVRGDGFASLRRDQNAGTFFELNNANTGSSAAPAYSGLRFAEGSTLKGWLLSLGSGSTATAGGANAMALWNLASAPLVFGVGSSERMRISPDGTVALNHAGTFNARLLVQHGVDNSNGIFVSHQPTVETTVSQTDKGLAIQVTESVLTGATNNGDLYGSHSWTFMTGQGVLHRMHGALIETGATGGGTIDEVFGLRLTSVLSSGSSAGFGYGVFVEDVAATSDYAFYQTGINDTNYMAGNVIIGGTPTTSSLYALSVDGDADFRGTVTGINIKAHYQDVAEWVPSLTDLAPGTVVILNRERNNEVMASTKSYDTTVAGVVSAQPGISLGIEGPGMEQVATTGRVKVRVDARLKPIQIGDLLVTSDTSGTAMRSEPMAINAREFHQPGTIIGKALEPLQSGIGEILVLLSMQ